MAKKLHQFMFVHILDKANHIVGSRFPKDVFPVSFDSSLADAQVARDLLIAEFFLDKAYHFEFAQGKGSALLGSL